MSEKPRHAYPRRKLGFMLGVAAMLCWAAAGAAASWLGHRLGTWPTIAVACGIGGIGQFVFYYFFMGRPVRDLLLPPPKLWLIIFLGFPLYELLHIGALANSAGENQTVGVNLINYLWPTLTVIFAVLWVPGTRGSWRLGIAAVVALAGVLVGNWRGVEAVGQTFLSDTTATGKNACPTTLPSLPYLIMFIAAVSWSVYSAILSRWRAWADRYSTATAGFLAVSAIAAVIATVRGDWRPLTGAECLVALLAGLVIYAAGYMLWELAIHRAPAEKLGLLSGATPILSTLCIFIMFAFAHTGERPDSAEVLRQLVAAGLIAGAVFISILPARPFDLFRAHD